MSSFKGFATLQSAHDLMRKLHHDFNRMKDSPADPYAALDFFITAYHMLEWIYPGDSRSTREQRESMERNSNLLKICSHLANGSKHFQATRKQHTSVRDVAIQGGAFEGGSFDATAFDVGELFVELDGDAAREFGQSLTTLDLAEKALQYWEHTVNEKGPGVT